MKQHLYFLLSFLSCLFVTGFLSCTKEVGEDDFEKSNILPHITDLDPGRMIAHHNKPDGGSIIVHNPMNGQQRDVYVSVLDVNGNVIRTTIFGSSRNEYINSTVMDEHGNLYLAGGTTSPELRMDPLKNVTDAGDGYIAKVDKDGNFLWQRGYCDVNSLHKGVKEDEYITIEIVNGIIYCLGFTENTLPIRLTGTISDYATWLVKFDQNGNILKDIILPSLLKGDNVLNYGGWTWMDAIKIEDENLIVRYSYFDYLSQGRTMDTTSMVFKLNTATDQVMWIQYFLRTSSYGDLANMGQLKNGNLVFFDSYYNSISILDPNTGNPISHRIIANNTGSATSTVYATKYYCNNFKIGDDYYVAGWMNFGGGTTDLKPWIIKLDKQGNVVFNKILPIQFARLWWIREVATNNLQLTGAISVFGTLLEKIFTVNMTPEGELIKSTKE